MRLHEAIDPRTIRKIVNVIRGAGGQAFIVGGAVRDKHIPGTPESKDVDFLITGLSRPEIVAAVTPIGKVKEVGEAFGVVTGFIDGEEFDFAIPRAGETKTGEGHSDFDVELDPNASAESDLARRDFTFNAMLEDPLTGETLDPFGGMEDLRNRIVRTVGDPYERFKEDPLRMLRALQFATRFGFDIESETAQAISDNADTLRSVAGERVMIELRKAWTKGKADTRVLVGLLNDLGVGDVFFGQDFDPIPIDMGGSAQDKSLGNFVAFFINGGNFKIMKPSNEYSDHLKTARDAVEHEGRDAWQWAGGDRERLSRVADILTLLNAATGNPDYARAADGINNTIDFPLTPKELAVNGGDLMATGIMGREVGQAQRTALEAIYAGDVRNEKQELLDFLSV